MTRPYKSQVRSFQKSCCNKTEEGSAQCCQRNAMVVRGSTCGDGCEDCRDVAKSHLEKFELGHDSDRLILKFTGWSQPTTKKIILNDIRQAVSNMEPEFTDLLVPNGPYTTDTPASDGYWELKNNGVSEKTFKQMRMDFNSRSPDIECSKASNPMLSFFEKALLEWCEGSKKREKNKWAAYNAINQENEKRFRNSGKDAAKEANSNTKAMEAGVQ
mmetsp:Transcript_54255/g.96232  ORF Transcript_54255/g.96232 Transcript_54255/m.96232 type:complete len:215 (-) Transcript_54255:149-793(-)